MNTSKQLTLRIDSDFTVPLPPAEAANRPEWLVQFDLGSPFQFNFYFWIVGNTYEASDPEFTAERLIRFFVKLIGSNASKTLAPELYLPMNLTQGKLNQKGPTWMQMANRVRAAAPPNAVPAPEKVRCFLKQGFALEIDGVLLEQKNPGVWKFRSKDTSFNLKSLLTIAHLVLRDKFAEECIEKYYFEWLPGPSLEIIEDQKLVRGTSTGVKYTLFQDDPAEELTVLFFHLKSKLNNLKDFEGFDELVLLRSLLELAALELDAPKGVIQVRVEDPAPSAQGLIAGVLQKILEVSAKLPQEAFGEDMQAVLAQISIALPTLGEKPAALSFEPPLSPARPLLLKRAEVEDEGADEDEMEADGGMDQAKADSIEFSGEVTLELLEAQIAEMRKQFLTNLRQLRNNIRKLKAKS